MGHSLPLFLGSLYFHLFYIVIKIADGWIWTADLWCRKRLLYQLCHNRCPIKILFEHSFSFIHAARFVLNLVLCPFISLVNERPTDWLTATTSKATIWLVKTCTESSAWPDWEIYWTLGNFLKPLATINLSISPTFLGNFCKGLRIYHCSSEIIFWQLLQTFGDFFLVTLIGIHDSFRWRKIESSIQDHRTSMVN